jgi:hypothetical protein
MMFASKITLRSSRLRYRNLLWLQIKLKEDMKRHEKEASRMESIRYQRMQLQSTSNVESKKTMLREELLAQIELKKRRTSAAFLGQRLEEKQQLDAQDLAAEERFERQKHVLDPHKPKARFTLAPNNNNDRPGGKALDKKPNNPQRHVQFGKSDVKNPPIANNVVLEARHLPEGRVDTSKPAIALEPTGTNGQGEIMKFISKLKEQEREVEERRQNTLRQLERLKYDIQRSIKEDREERLHLIQNMGGHILPYSQASSQRQHREDDKLDDVMSITSGTSFSSNSLAQQSKFIGLQRPHL